MVLRALAIAFVTALALGGCGEEASAPVAAAAAEPQADQASEPGNPAPRRARTTPVRLEASDYGSVLFDRKGGALYLFTSDTQGKSTCYGACAKAWPPFIARGRPRAREDVEQALLGTTLRRDGRRQVTYAGHPLYYYVDDPPHQILCHGVNEFGGDWLVVQASGEPAP
jgi:predicted lipoprotein with Yx(FWY)xxD motif